MRGGRVGMESRTDRDGVSQMSATPDEGGATRTDESGTDKVWMTFSGRSGISGTGKCGQTGSGGKHAGG